MCYKKLIAVFFSVILTALSSSATIPTGVAQYSTSNLLPDSFERSDAPAPWTFNNGAEFPGAAGSLTVGTGYHGNGAKLFYNFSGGGAYVSADLELGTTAYAQAVSFWVKSPAGIRIRLRVRDNSGQTLQYNLSRPLEAVNPEVWYRHIVQLSSPSLFWGGANDGLLHDGITGISILAGDPLDSGLIGSIEFDEV